MKNCKMCGSELPDEAIFCTKCGTVCEDEAENTTKLAESSVGTVPSYAEVEEPTELLQNDNEGTIVLEGNIEETAAQEVQNESSNIKKSETEASFDKTTETFTNSTPSKKNGVKNFFSKKSKKEKIAIIVAPIVVLIPVIIFAVLAFMYNGVQPTISTWGGDFSSGWVWHLPVSVKEASIDFDIDINTIDIVDSTVLEGNVDGRTVYLSLNNDSDEVKSIDNSGKITEIYIDKGSGKRISIGSRGQVFGFSLNDNNSLYTRGIYIGMRKDALIKNNGQPSNGFLDDYEDDSIQYANYVINCYNAINVTLKDKKVVKVQYSKSKNIFDFQVYTNMEKYETKNSNTDYYSFDGSIKIENKDLCLKFNLPISVKDIQSFGTISEEQLDDVLDPAYGSNLGGVYLKWNGYDIGLWCFSDSKKKVPVRDSMVGSIDLSTYDGDNIKDLSINGFDFSMTPEEIIEKCGKPSEIDDEGNGVLCYRYEGTKDSYLFAFENGKMSQISFSIGW